MGFSDYEDDGLLNRFDAYCKRTVRNTGCKILRDEKRWRDRFVSFSDLPPGYLENISTHDTYDILQSHIKVDDVAATIENDLLYNALLLLPENRLKIIIWSYFGDMTDLEIGRKMMLAQSTVQYNRVGALSFIRNRIEEMKKNEDYSKGKKSR